MRPMSKKAGIAAAALLVLLFGAPRAEAASKKIDLNTATQAELEGLPGVGAATAKKIIGGRPYSSVSDLSRAGVSDATIQKISPLVTVHGGSPADKSDKSAKSTAKSPTPKKGSPKESSEKSAASTKSKAPAAASSVPVDLNTASEAELEALPGVGSATAKKIIDGRPYSSVSDLSRAGVSASTIEKISPLVVAGGRRTASAPRVAPAAPAAASGSSPEPASAKTSSSATAAAAAPPQAEAPYQAPPRAGMVWVNTSTKVYHYEGDRWYGRTKEGKYMTERDAIAAGFRASKQKGETEKQ